jgi:tetratricopeptide (TPR) repeat protein
MQTYSLQLPPPSNWQDFEKLCCDLWSCIWDYPNTCRNSRQGQSQHGVDVYGCPQKGNSWAGVQCKCKDSSTDKTLTKEEVEEEVEKAKGFQPKLSEYIIATTGPRDANIQEVARKISENHKSQGLFSVSVFAWEDIVLKLQDYPELLSKHFPEIITTSQINKKIDKVAQGLNDFKENQDAIKSTIEQGIERMDSQFSSIAYDKSDYNERIDYGKDLLKKYQPFAALDYYKNLKDKIWHKSQPHEKYRILTNLGASELALKNESAAAKLFIEAFQYNSEEDKALCNRAFGHYLLNQIPDAIKYANTALEKNPSNCYAYSLIIRLSPPEESFEMILSKVPNAYLTNLEVAYSLSFVARERKLFDVARKWAEVAIENDVEKSPELKAALATAILNEIFCGKPVPWLQVREDQKDKVTRAIELFSSAWDAISEAAYKKTKTSWLANRSLAKRMLNDIQGATKDIDIILELDPDNPDYIKRRALLSYEVNDLSKTVALLEKISDNPQTPEASLILAEVLGKQKKSAVAISLVQKIIDKNDLRLVGTARELLMRLYIDANKYDDAKALAENILTEDPNNIFALIVLSQTPKHQSEKLDILLKANQYVDSATPLMEILALADEFYSLGQWCYAVPLYEKCVGDSVYHPLVRKLIQSYYQAGDYGKALKICEDRLKQPLPPVYVSEIASSIYETIGDLDRAVFVCNECLKNYPDDMSIKLRLAIINYRRDKLSDVDEFLNSEIKTDSLSLSDGAALAYLYLERDFSMKALEIMYEIRRKYYQEADAHLKYIGVVLRRNKRNDELLKNPEVTIDTAVLVEDDTKQQTWYIIENRENPQVAMGEISTEHLLAKKMIGKRVGDQILINENSGTHVQVKAIKNKYVHALHISMQNFNKMFPENSNLLSINMEIPQKSNELSKGMQTIISQLEQRTKRIRDVETLYKEGNLTIGGLGMLIGKNIWDVWVGLKSSWGVRCCMGTVEERQAALSSLKNPNRLVCDVLAILTLNELKMADIVVKRFGKLAIAQSVVDVLFEILKDFKNFPREMTISAENGKLRTQQHDPEIEKKNIKKIEELMEWIKHNCEIISTTAALNENKNRLVDLEEILGKSFLDSIFIAKEINGLLYSEDERLRSLAKNEFGITGVWTQVVLIACAKDNKLSKQEYNAATISLVVSKYFHITIDADVISHAAREVKRFPSVPFNIIVARLGKQYCDESSSLSVGINAMYELYRQPVLPTLHRAQLVLGIINSMVSGRSKSFLDNLKQGISMRFQLLPLAEYEILSTISALERTHLYG